MSLGPSSPELPLPVDPDDRAVVRTVVVGEALLDEGGHGGRQGRLTCCPRQHPFPTQDWRSSLSTNVGTSVLSKRKARLASVFTASKAARFLLENAPVGSRWPSM